jgi:hypothetical protein
MQTLKIAVVAVVAALALLAVTAGPAFALEGFEAAEYPAEVKGEKEGAEGQTFTADKLSVNCKVTTEAGFFEEGEETIEVTPSYSECLAGGVSAKVTNEECKYKLHAGTTKTDISCPVGKSIKIVAVKEECEMTIGTQSNVGTVEYVKHEEASPKNVTMKLNLKEMKYNKTKDAGSCPFTGTGEKSDGTLTGVTLMKAFNVSSTAENLFIGAVTSPILCSANEAVCAAPYPLASTELEMTANVEPAIKIELFGTPETMKCFASTIEGTTNNKGISSIKATIKTFSLTKCVTGTFTCTVSEVSNTPLDAHIYAGGKNPGEGSIQFYKSGKRRQCRFQIHLWYRQM